MNRLSTPSHEAEATPSTKHLPASQHIEEDHSWHQQEERRSLELSQFISHLQSQLRLIHRSLGDRYRPDLEGRIERLSMERDEAIISWGRSLLGLCEGGAQLQLVSSTGEEYLLLSETNLFANTTEELDQLLADEAKTVGESTTRTFGELDPSISSIGMATETPVQSQPNDHVGEKLDLDLISEADGEELEDDPGIADAPQLSLTQFSLSDLRERMLKPKSWHDDNEEEDDEENHHELATSIVMRLGGPKDLNGSQFKEHLIELEAEVECCQRWSIFTQDLQHAIVTLITSRLRDIQDRIGDSTFDQERIAKMFRRLTRFSSDFRPGFVHGLSRDKIPEFDSWRADEVHAWRRIETLLDLTPSLPKLTPEREQKLNELKLILQRRLELDDFSNLLRNAVTECLNAGLPHESPYLVRLLEEHLSHLSGKRFKKLRLAVAARQSF